MTTPGAVTPDPRFGLLAGGHPDDELRVAATGREGQGKRAAEARVDVGDALDDAVLAEALDGRRSAQREGLDGADGELRRARDRRASRP